MVAIVLLRSWRGAVLFFACFLFAALSIGWGWHFPRGVQIAFRVAMGASVILALLWVWFGASSKQ